MLCWNKALWLVKNSHGTWCNQSECSTSAFCVENLKRNAVGIPGNRHACDLVSKLCRRSQFLKQSEILYGDIFEYTWGLSLTIILGTQVLTVTNDVNTKLGNFSNYEMFIRNSNWHCSLLQWVQASKSRFDILFCNFIKFQYS